MSIRWGRVAFTALFAYGMAQLLKSEKRRNLSGGRKAPAVDLSRWEDEGGNVPEVETVAPRSNETVISSSWIGERSRH